MVPVGSGITLAAILRGLRIAENPTPVLGVRVAGDPTSTLNRHAPGWDACATLITSRAAYADTVPNRLGDLVLDPHYEAKVLPHLRAGDLLWAVGVRASALA
ncbi:hypothetical protein ACIRJS_23110 [Streptomyces sp. NPDC102340]|uniref:hypothetical protein n=1 Tax=unclassified Streptomyces TaxID=2593676 RepID=UPI00380D8F80